MAHHEFIPETRLNHWINDLDDIIDTTSTVYSDILDLQNSLSLLEQVYAHEEFLKIKFQILAGLEKEMARVLGGNGARIAASLAHDRVVLKAIEVLSSGAQVQEILAGPTD